MPATTDAPVGKVIIMQGTVKAVSAEGVERVLTPNSPIYANDLIITESDASASIAFNDPTQPQLNLGRMTEMTIDEDVYNGDTGADPADAAASVQEIQTALAAGASSIICWGAPWMGRSIARLILIIRSAYSFKTNVSGLEIRPRALYRIGCPKNHSGGC